MILGDFRAVFLPYCLQKQENGRYAVLNRIYKPVGFFTTDWVKYKEHPVLVKIKGLPKAKAAERSDKGKTDFKELFLYSEATNPVSPKSITIVYLEKLDAILARLSLAKSHSESQSTVQLCL